MTEPDDPVAVIRQVAQEIDDRYAYMETVAGKAALVRTTFGLTGPQISVQLRQKAYKTDNDQGKYGSDEIGYHWEYIRRTYRVVTPPLPGANPRAWQPPVMCVEIVFERNRYSRKDGPSKTVRYSLEHFEPNERTNAQGALSLELAPYHEFEVFDANLGEIARGFAYTLRAKQRLPAVPFALSARASVSSMTRLQAIASMPTPVTVSAFDPESIAQLELVVRDIIRRDVIRGGATARLSGTSTASEALLAMAYSFMETLDTLCDPQTARTINVADIPLDVSTYSVSVTGDTITYWAYGDALARRSLLEMLESAVSGLPDTAVILPSDAVIVRDGMQPLLRAGDAQPLAALTARSPQPSASREKWWKRITGLVQRGQQLG